MRRCQSSRSLKPAAARRCEYRANEQTFARYENRPYDTHIRGNQTVAAAALQQVRWTRLLHRVQHPSGGRCAAEYRDCKGGMKMPRILCLLPAIVPFALFASLAHARAGGGDYLDIALYAALLPIALTIMAIIAIRRRKMMAKAKADLAVAASTDGSWDLSLFTETARKVFFAYQEAWLGKNLQAVRSLLHARYYAAVNDEMHATLRGKKNILKDASIISLNLMSVKDVAGKDGDKFVMEIEASMIDYTVNEKSGKFLRSPLGRKKDESDEAYAVRATKEPHSFTEYWVFTREQGNWLLSDIKQDDAIVADIYSDIKTLGIAGATAKAQQVLADEKKSDKVDDSAFYK